MSLLLYYTQPLDLFQMYMVMDALADGGVYAGVPKDLALKLTAYTMMVGSYIL